MGKVFHMGSCTLLSLKLRPGRSSHSAPEVGGSIGLSLGREMKPTQVWSVSQRNWLVSIIPNDSSLVSFHGCLPGLLGISQLGTAKYSQRRTLMVVVSLGSKEN